MTLLGLGLRLPAIAALGGEPPIPPLDLSALTALPEGRQAAATAAAETAATTLSVSAQSIIDALAVGRGLASFIPNDGCLLASSGGATTVQGDPVGAIRSWTGTELATQSNASLRPTSAAAGLSTDGSKTVDLGNLSAYSAPESFIIFNNAANTINTNYWYISTAAGAQRTAACPNNTNGAVLENFGADARANVGIAEGTLNGKFIYNVGVSSGNRTHRINNDAAIDVAITQGIATSSTLLSSPAGFFTGNLLAFALNSTNYSTAQRNAVREFCKAYYGVTY